MASGSKEEGCKIKAERTPSRAPGALAASSARPETKQPGARSHTETRPRRGAIQHGIADADKRARTGSEQEPVRNTPPAGDWNDVA